MSELCRPEFTLLVAGSRGGKTSFLRLLLDTSDIAPSTSSDQLASVAKFVHGCSGHTTYIRATSIDIEPDAGPPLALNLIDTPSLDFRDDAAAERTIADTLRLIDARFLEGREDERKALSGDRYVHLCIYFLDPDNIVPPSVARPPAPLVPRTRTNSFSQPDQEPVILEPPVTTNPLMFRPTLPAADIATIRRLSARVNVLPVIARADVLSNERLAAVKTAVRRDLADAGIGFGIFDMDNHASNPPSVHSPEDPKLSVSAPDPSPNNNGSNGYPSNHLNGGSNSTASAATSPPTSPVSPSIMRLPYALVAPDIYSHSEGVPRVPPPRHELVHQYTPSPSGAKNARRGKFLRYYRWGNLDVLDPAHCDFVPLRNAIFHHMETLQKYTREYLFEKFRSDYIQLQQQQRPPSRHSSHPHPHTAHPHTHPHPHAHSPHAISHLTHPLQPHGHMGGLAPHPARPILAIDTQPPPQHPPPPQGLHHPQPGLPSIGRHPQSVSIPTSSRDMLSGPSDVRTPGSGSSARAGGLGSSGIAASGDSPVASASGSGRTGSGRPGQLNTTNKTRSKKITVACNFCRSRKLKCDGGRPACGQCLKRSNPCDYAPQNKRRNTIRQPRRSDITGGSSSRPGGEEDEDSATGGDYNRGESGNEDGRSEVSMSPEVHTVPLSAATAAGSVSAPISRRSSNVDKRDREGGYVPHHSLPPILGRADRERDDLHPGPSSRAPPPPGPQQPSSSHPSLHHLSDRDRDRDPHPHHLRDRDPPPISASQHQNPPSSHLAPPPPPPPSSSSGGERSGRPFFADNELPHIATLSLPDRSSPSTPGPMSAPSLPPIRPASEQQAALRKRAATVPGKSGSGRGSGSGPKVVACNSCRARKTKCDGAHPACASCSRRQVACLYVHDLNGSTSRDRERDRDPTGSGGGGGGGGSSASSSSSTFKKRRASASVHQQQPGQQPQQRQHHHQTSQSSHSHTPTRQGVGYLKDEDGSSQSLSPPSSRMLVTPSTAGAGPGPSSVDLLERHVIGGGGGGGHHHLHSHHRHHHSSSSSGYPAYRGGGSDDGIIDDRDPDRFSDSRESLSLREREREMDMDLKRPLPLEHLERDVEMRSPRDEMDLRAVKKMRMEEGRTAAPIGGIP
ncbi:hypothetical protein P691DRAFT_758092 [Macrolepiota fuliginosa MF-IS2]|uniref:Zn(2)-C6 fungal-type domain-containing protein n=1 Tax=Macrolepiota fuliginosa MF-IS2 TaxID=1400762 RepID=A0A9P5XFQ9_9AGAR|nr:hypothetical protein P691DRAFT_758092 [Macrolepiota fuliginosa MF-IS2]